MRHGPPKLAVRHLAFGIDCLLKSLENHDWQTHCLTAANETEELLARQPEPEVSAGFNAVNRRFHDGVVFELFGWCTKADGAFSLETCMRWWWAEAERRADGSLGLAPGHFRFDVVVVPFEAKSAPKPSLRELDIDPQMERMIRSLERKATSSLDGFARHRIFIPPPTHRDQLVGIEWLAQLVIRAAKSGYLRAIADDGRETVENEACKAFRKYANSLGVSALERLRPEEKSAASDAVFRRLVMSSFGRGFLAAPSPYAFRAYVRIALNWAARDVRTKMRIPYSSGSGKYRNRSQMFDSDEDLELDGGTIDDVIPKGIVEAAERLGVSSSTIWRRMQAHGYSTLTPAAWRQVSSEIKSKHDWQAIQAFLVDRGSGLPAARKQVQRWKKMGKDPISVAQLLIKDGSVK